MSGGRDAPLLVAGYTATRAGDPDRGPLVRLNAQDAASRLLVDGELVYVEGRVRRDLARLVVDDACRRGEVHLRDVAGAVLADVVRVRRPEFDPGPRPRPYLA